MSVDNLVINVDAECPLLISSIEMPDEESEPGYYLSFRDDVEAWIVDNLEEDVCIELNVDEDAHVFSLCFGNEEDILAFKIKWIL